MDAANLPAAPSLATELVKTAGQAPAEVIKPGVRAHLGISIFQGGDPVAAEIAQGRLEHSLPSLLSVTSKRSPKLMQNTVWVQNFLNSRGFVFPEPLLLNPVPHSRSTDWQHMVVQEL